MLHEILTVVFTVLIAGTLIVMNGYFWTWVYHATTGQDETHYFLTEDGWRLAVHRYRRRKGPSQGAPVVLCHGLGSNRFIFDVHGCASLARFLRNRGRDVWVAELRGSGMSECPGLLISDVPYSWTFDDHLEYDVPAIVSHVISRSGASSLHWVGHSMGGMLIHAYLAKTEHPRIYSAVTLGSPTDLSKIKMRAVKILSRLRFLLTLFPIPPMPFNGRLIVPIAHRLPGFLLGLFYPPNIDAEVAKAMVAQGSQLITSRELWIDFGRFVDTKSFASEDGKPYLSNLSQCNVPIFFASGSKDVMAPPDAVCSSYVSQQHVGERKFHVFGKDTGTSEDYGHVDLLVGVRAEKEVFPDILEWITEHDPLDSRETKDPFP